MALWKYVKVFKMLVVLLCSNLHKVNFFEVDMFKNQFELNDVAQHEFTVLTAVWTCCDLIYSVIRPAQSKASSVALLLAISEPLVKWQNHFTHLELFLWQGNALPRVSHFRQFHLFLPSAAGPVRVWHGIAFHSCHFCPNFLRFP